MGWIRSHTRSGAWLAIVALAAQLVATFGHVHAEWFSTPSLAGTAIATAGLHVSDHSDGVGTPPQPYRPPVAHKFCAVCVSASLMGALVLPVAQSLAPPPIIVRICELKLTGAATPGAPRSSFQPRAPPSA
jgi:hypothetical protein